MSRTREWIKFGTLIGVTLALAVVFISLIDAPTRSLAQQPAIQPTANRPAPVQAPQPVIDLGNAFASVAEVVRPAVVYIQSQQRVEARAPQQQHPELPAPFDRFFIDPREDSPQRPQRGSGSGFIISPDGYIMTNNHVVDGFDFLDVRLFDGRKFSAKVVGRDSDTDIAVIKIDARDLQSVSLGNSDSLRVGEWVLAIGNPFGQQFSFTVTAGIVSGRGRLLNLAGRSDWSISDFIQTDAAINPGNSGGPLVNIRGQVVGVNSAIASQTGFYSGYSFAIPINLARTVGDQLIANGKVTRAALGVRVQAATDADAEYVGLEDVRGVVIHDFASDNSPAKRAGLDVGDVIIAVDGKEVDYVAQLQQIVGFKRPGERVTVTVMRPGGKRQDFTVRLIEAGAEPPARVASVEEPRTPASGTFERKLGIAVEDASSNDAARNLRLADEQRGLIITAVDPNGPARDVLAAADAQQRYLPIITHVNGQRIRTPADLQRALATVRSGEVVSLRLFETIADTPRSRVVRFRAGGEQ
jgi:serine protease Do